MKKGRPGDDILRALYPTEPMPDVLTRLQESTGQVWTKKEVFNRAHVLGILRQVREKMLPPALGTLRKPVTIDADKVLLCSDSHVPFHDRHVWAEICKVGREWGIDTLVHIGDFVDAQSFAKFDPMAVPIPWEREEAAASDLIAEVSAVFPRIVLLTGNHEARIVKRLAGQLPYSGIMRGWECFDIVPEGAVDVEDLPVAWLGDWGMVCHPAAYSQTSGAVAVKLAEKYGRDVYMGHDHYMALRIDRSGRYKAVSVGCCCREDMTDYKTMTVSTHPRWNRGFVVVDKRIPHFYFAD
jgi:hypothetical protein